MNVKASNYYKTKEEMKRELMKNKYELKENKIFALFK
jgi:hypothetical protein